MHDSRNETVPLPAWFPLTGGDPDPTVQGSVEPPLLRFSLPSKSRVRLPCSTPRHAANVRLVAYTWHYGRPAWIPAMAPAMVNWARRNGVDLRVWRQSPSSDPASGSALAGMLQDFLAGDAAWMIYLDADVMIHPLAPHPLETEFRPGLWVLPQPGASLIGEDWSGWVEKHFERRPSPAHGYCNDGVWLLDRATAERFLPYLQRPMMPAKNHPHYFNLCLSDAVGDGSVKSFALPEIWNRLPPTGMLGREHRAWFYHCAGPDKSRVLANWQIGGFLPQPRPAMTIKPWPAKARLAELIAIPFHLEGDPMKGESLRYLLRSIDQHWQHSWPVLVYGTARPAWLDEAVFQLEPSYPQAYLRAFCLAERVLWINDDMFYLKDSSVEDHEVPLCYGDLIPQLPEMLASENRWQRARGHIASRLHHEQGLDRLMDFSVHYPFLFEREKARQVFDHFGVWHKYQMELAYHGLHGSVGRPADEFATFETRDFPGKRWLNVQDPLEAGAEWATWMAARFPTPSRWEIPG
jgi:hypothetical protein